MPSKHAPPATPLGVANVALGKARTYRGEWLVGLAEGVVSPLDLFLAAMAPGGGPLRRLRLVTVLSAQPGWGTTRTHTTLERFHAQAGRPRDGRPATVGWLIDRRSQGRRLARWVGTTETMRDTPPWPGFPWTPAPTPSTDPTMSRIVRPPGLNQ